MIEVDCRKFVNCTGEVCIPFGYDADIAVKNVLMICLQIM